MLCTETNSVVDTLTVTAEPSCVAVSPDGKSAVHRRPRGRHHGDVRRAPTPTELETELMAMNVSTAPALRELEPAGV